MTLKGPRGSYFYDSNCIWSQICYIFGLHSLQNYTHEIVLRHVKSEGECRS